MAKNSEFYKGARKKRNYAIVPFIIILFLISVIIVLFYSMQKYAVITDNGLSIKLPFLSDDSDTVIDASGNEVRVFDTVDANLILNEADYSGVEATAGKNLKGVRAIFIPYEQVLDIQAISEYAARLSTGNSLLFELKRADGYLAWYSDTPTAATYGLNMASPDSKAQLVAILTSLKEDKNVYLVAQISCCVDDLFAAHCTQVGLCNQFGMHYGDTYGYYLDPYSELVRNYTVELVNELYDMGFDEVVLQDVRHPVIELNEDGEPVSDITFTYSRDMSTTPSPSGAVCGFAVNVAEALADRESGKVLSIYLNSSTSLVKTDEKNGQSGPLFAKLYDRLYYSTDRYAYTFNVEDIRPSITVGSVENRFVPVVINYLPDEPSKVSWVLVDKETD